MAEKWEEQLKGEPLQRELQRRLPKLSQKGKIWKGKPGLGDAKKRAVMYKGKGQYIQKAKLILRAVRKGGLKKGIYWNWKISEAFLSPKKTAAYTLLTRSPGRLPDRLGVL